MAPSKKASVAIDTPISRTSSTSSISKTKKKGTSKAVEEVTSSNVAEIPGGVATEQRRGAFADPPRIIGNSPLRQAASKASLSASPSASKTGNKRKAGTPSRASRKSRASPLFNTLRFGILTSLVAYTVVVCPHSGDADSAVCGIIRDSRGLVNHYIFQPYIRPRIDDVLAHPTVLQVTQPLEKYAGPVAHKMGELYDEGTYRAYNLYLVYSAVARAELIRHSLPYAEAARKQYEAHLAPIVDTRLLPAYQVYIAPTLGVVVRYGSSAAKQLEPYLWHSATALRHAGMEAQPYMAQGWEQVLRAPEYVREHAWEPLVDMRRTYVDAPITQIMETVDEVGGETKPLPHNDGDTVEEGMSVGEQRTAEGSENVPLDETAASHPPGPTEPQQAHLVQADIPLTESPELLTTESIPIAPPDELDVNLDEFIRELAESDTVQAEAPVVVADDPSQTQVAETPEEVLERQRLRNEATAKKRAELNQRHEAWEHQLQTLFGDKVAALPRALEPIRAGEVDALVRAEYAEAMRRDADKALRNTEAFVRKLVAETRAGGTVSQADQIALLESIVGKVKKRFDDGASVVSGNVMTWLENTRRNEADEIEKSVKEVRDLGTAAQADLGLKYAWLDDVTVNDWTRYHALLRVAKDLQAKLTALADGSDPDAPQNALSDYIRDLQVDLETVALRFRNELNAVHQRAVHAIQDTHIPENERSALRSTATPSRNQDEPVMSILPIEPERPDGSAAEAGRVILGKSKEQLEQASKLAMGEEQVREPPPKNIAPARLHPEL